MTLKNKIKTVALITSLSVVLSNVALAHESSNDLKSIMQGLLNDSLVLNQAIIDKDFSKIKIAADGIADHPKPGIMTMKNVIMELGSQMSHFKTYDSLVHEISVKISEAADKKNLVTVKSNYQQLLSGCLSCHTKFKKRISNILR